MAPLSASERDAADPLAGYRGAFLGAGDAAVPVYLDGNSLGRPLAASRERLLRVVDEEWAGRLIRGWDDGWLALPETVGDELGAACLGADAGQVIVADSTTVLLYKLVRAACALRPGRTRLVVDTAEFPTDRFVVDGIAREAGLEVVRLTSPHDGGVDAEMLADVLDDRVAAVLVSHVSYRSGHLADLAALASAAHAVGALLVADCSHSVGSVDVRLDADDVDLAAGCSYKYLNGGPGAPAWCYVAHRHQDALEQPIPGWLGAAEPFAMEQGFRPASGIRRMTSGTPPILGMQAMRDMIALIGEVGIRTVRAKSVALTSYAIELADELTAPLGATLASPRDAARRGGHVTLDHSRARDAVARLTSGGVIPDFRGPDGVRVGLSPLSTSFAETELGMRAVAEALAG